MSHLLLQTEFETGGSIEFVPKFIRPLGVDQLLALTKNPSTALAFEVESEEAKVNGIIQKGQATIKTSIQFGQPSAIFSLVRGGWLPPPFTIPQRFLVDRNVVSALRKIREGSMDNHRTSVNWWLNFFEHGTALLNPLPYAFESGFRRKPSFKEFIESFNEGAMELRLSFPKCQVVTFGEHNYRAGYAQLLAFDRRLARESEFLIRVAPLVAMRAPRRSEKEILGEILRIGSSLEIVRGSMVSLSVLSCLYDDVQGEAPSIGRLIIKPKSVYTDQDAYNAISDLRHIEIAAAGQTYFSEGVFSLCTCDRALALFWSALALRGEVTKKDEIEFTFDLCEELFPRLTGQELESLRNVLAEEI